MVFKAIMNGLIKAKAMPQISPTERQALEAGTVWIDGQVFFRQARLCKNVCRALFKTEPA